MGTIWTHWRIAGSGCHDGHEIGKRLAGGRRGADGAVLACLGQAGKLHLVEPRSGDTVFLEFFSVLVGKPGRPGSQYRTALLTMVDVDGLGCLGHQRIDGVAGATAGTNRVRDGGASHPCKHATW